MNAVLDYERSLGFEPNDVSDQTLGWDIESVVPETGSLRFIEVKGRVSGADTVTVTRNEILAGLNKPDDFYLAIVFVNSTSAEPIFIQKPFGQEPEFGVTSVNYKLSDLLARDQTKV